MSGKEETVLVVAKYDYTATDAHELHIRKGEKLRLIDDSQHWWRVMNSGGEYGYVPSNYVKKTKQGLFSSLRNTLGRKKHKSDGGKGPANGRHHFNAASPSPAGITSEENSAASPSNQGGSEANLSSVGAGGGSQSQLRCDSPGPPQITSSANMVNNAPKPVPLRPPYHQINDGMAQPQPQQPLPPQLDPRVASGENGGIPATSKASSPPRPSSVDTQSDLCIARFAYTATQADELSIARGDRIRVVEKSPDGWWRGEFVSAGGRTAVGWFPSNYVAPEENGDSLSRREHAPSTSSSCDYFNCSRQDHHHHHHEEESKSGEPHMVVSLYPFTRSQVEELSFEGGETLEIVEKPDDDPDWWKARNSRGDVGLVPRNYVRLVDSGTSNGGVVNREEVRRQYLNSGIYSDKEWYWGTISRSECEDMLNKDAKMGQFIVRDSESHPGDLTVTMHAGNKNRNFKVHVDEGQFHIGQKVFDGIDDLIQHYRTHPIYKSDTEKHYLTEPFRLPASK